MAITPVDLLELADRLADEGDEVSHRAAASRAYYSAFHASEPIAAQLPEAPAQGVGRHERIIRRFALYKSGTPDMAANIRAIGKLLSQGKMIRTHADYRLAEDFMKAKAVELLGIARAIQERAQRIRDLGLS